MVNTLAVDNDAKQTIEALHTELQKTKEKLQAVEELKSQSGIKQCCFIFPLPPSYFSIPYSPYSKIYYLPASYWLRKVIDLCILQNLTSKRDALSTVASSLIFTEWPQFIGCVVADHISSH